MGSSPGPPKIMRKRPVTVLLDCGIFDAEIRSAAKVAIFVVLRRPERDAFGVSVSSPRLGEGPTRRGHQPGNENDQVALSLKRPWLDGQPTTMSTQI